MNLSLGLAASFMSRLFKDCLLFAIFFLVSTAICFFILRDVDYKLGTKTIEVPQVLKAGTVKLTSPSGNS